MSKKSKHSTSLTSSSIRTRNSSTSPSAPSTGGKAALMRLSAAARRTLLIRYVKSSGSCSSILRWATAPGESMMSGMSKGRFGEMPMLLFCFVLLSLRVVFFFLPVFSFLFFGGV